VNFRRLLIRRILIDIDHDLKTDINVRQGMEMIQVAGGILVREQLLIGGRNQESYFHPK
jgi:hypothetical protein